jgi:hypothetical protein
MLKTKQYLSLKEKAELTISIDELSDVYGEFYITKNKLRLFLKENIDSLWKTLKKGDKIIFGEQAIGVITGYADKEIEIIDNITNLKKMIPSRKYLTILTKDLINLDRLLRYVSGEFKTINLFTKIKVGNPVLKTFYANGFKFVGGRGKELLLVKSIDSKPEFIFRKYEDDREEIKKRIK